MSDYQTRNYTAHGGKPWRSSEASAGVSAACGANETPGSIGAHGAESVIGGKLTFLPGAEVEGLEGLLPSMQPPQLPAQDDSAATTIAALKDDFNALLSKMRTAGLMASADAGGDEA